MAIPAHSTVIVTDADYAGNVFGAVLDVDGYLYIEVVDSIDDIYLKVNSQPSTPSTERLVSHYNQIVSSNDSDAFMSTTELTGGLKVAASGKAASEAYETGLTISKAQLEASDEAHNARDELRKLTSAQDDMNATLVRGVEKMREEHSEEVATERAL